MRLIDADALIKLWSDPWVLCGEFTAYHVLDSIKKAPTVELGAETEKQTEQASNGDFIARQSAIAAVLKLCDDAKAIDYTNIYAENPHIDAVVDVLENVPSVEPDFAKNINAPIKKECAFSARWIPCKERPPENSQKVLCQDENGNMTVGSYSAWGWTFPHYFENPSAWMPLPESYKEKK